MNQKQLERMTSASGFVAALDQSGGSTPKALKAYGINEDAYHNEEEMYDVVHQMRTRIIKSPSFNSNKILGAILFENTMNKKIDDLYTADYLWDVKGIIPFLKVDKGLADIKNGVRLMKDIPELTKTLSDANKHHIFGTKMRSVILEANSEGIKEIVDQQFELGQKIFDAGLIPIIEPEVDINCPEKEKAEQILKEELLNHLNNLKEGTKVIFKLTIPSIDNYYSDLIKHPGVIRVVALSGGYSQDDACLKLARNHGMIASFSRALAQDLRFQQSDEEFDDILAKAIDKIYEASIA